MMQIIKTKNGQVMVLDVVFTIVLIILIFLLLFRWTEVKTYQSTTDRHILELNSISRTAFNSITQNPSINCYATDANNYFLMSSCFGADSNISKEKLGIPDNYNCSFIINGFSLGINDCTDNLPSNIDNYSKVTFNVITNSTRAISKNIYLSNILNKANTLPEREATLVIWK